MLELVKFLVHNLQLELTAQTTANAHILHPTCIVYKECMCLLRVDNVQRF